MAQNSLNIYQIDGETKEKLKEVLKGVVENIQVGCVSEAIKNRQGSGDPEGGTISYKRFKNAELVAKGTARAAGAGVAVKADTVLINLDDDKEIVEELQKKDIKLYGIAGMAERRKANFAKRVQAYLDTKFFATAKTAGTAYTGSKTDYKDIIDEMIVTAKTVSSNFIDGIDAMDLCMVLDATARKALKNDLDALPNGTRPANGLIGTYDSIDVHESNRMPAGTHVMIMLKGAVAQPWYVSDYDAEKIPMDDSIALETFLYRGAGALNPEAIFFQADSASV